MMNGYWCEIDGVSTESFGMVLGEWNKSSEIESINSTSSYDINLDKGVMSNIFDLLSVECKETMKGTLHFGFLKPPISRLEFSKIQYRFFNKQVKLKFIDDSDKDWYYYDCVLSNPQAKYKNGGIIGVDCEFINLSEYGIDNDEVVINFTQNGDYVINCESQQKTLSPYIKLVCNSDNGNITLKNNTLGIEFTISNLDSGEIIEIQDDYRITTSKSDTIYRLSNCTFNDFFKLTNGENNISITGNFSSVQIKYRNKYIVGV